MLAQQMSDCKPSAVLCNIGLCPTPLLWQCTAVKRHSSAHPEAGGQQAQHPGPLRAMLLRAAGQHRVQQRDDLRMSRPVSGSYADYARTLGEHCRFNNLWQRSRTTVHGP